MSLRNTENLEQKVEGFGIKKFISNVGKYAVMKVLPVALSVAMPFVPMGCFLNKDNNTSSGSSASNYAVQAKDFDGNPIQGAQLSVYDASLYDPVNNTGNFGALVPKTSGYYTSDANGNFSLNLADGKYHFVVKADGKQTEWAFNATVPGPLPDAPDKSIPIIPQGKAANPNSPNVTVECCPGNDGNFNSEGHIKYQENYTHNKYAPGDKVKFYVWGDNKTGLEQKVSFCVLDRTENGNPKIAPVVYRGNFTDANETLVVPDGEKTHRVFELTVPKTWNDGKHTIFVTWPGYDGYPEDGIPDAWKEVGNFFKIPDTTPPTLTLNLDKTQYFTNESPQVWASVSDPAEAGTVRSENLDIMAASPVDILIDKGDGNGFQNCSGAPITLPEYGAVTTGTFADIGKNSGYYIIQGKVSDFSGNVSEIASTPQVAIHINKEEAGAIADILYNQYKIGLNDDPGNYFTDYTKTTTKTATPFDVLCDKFNNSYKAGHNYDKQGGLTDGQITELEQVITDLSGPEFIRYLARVPKGDFVTELTAYLEYLKVNGKIPP